MPGETPAPEAGKDKGNEAIEAVPEAATMGNGAAPLSRQQRRALERQEKKAARRLANAAAAAAA